MNSPAHKAKFVSNSDYIIGSFEDSFVDFDDFVEIVNGYAETRSRLDLLVFNSQTGCIRLVKIFPE